MDTPTPRPSLHLGALLSFVLGLASFALCLLGVSGVPALVIGYRSLRAVNSSEGRRSGAWLAVAGMLLGGLATLATAGGLLALTVVELQLRGARVGCQDNLRRVGFSLNKYADGNKSFPPAVVGPAGLPPERQLAWTCEVVPSLGSGGVGQPAPRGKQDRLNKHFEEIAGLVDRTKAWDDAANQKAVDSPIRFFRCPASPDYDPGERPGLTNYVGMAGVGPDAAALRRADARAGFFGYDRGVKLSELEVGISHVMVVVETGQDLGPWLAGGPPTVRDLSPDAGHYTGRGMPFGGLHPGATNVLWADGSVRPVSDRYPGELMRQQATLRGGEP